VSVGTYAVTAGHSGMFGLVFDNTFSKALSKTATFVLLTYPSGAPPNTMHNLQGGQGSMANALSVSGKSQSPRLGAVASQSVDSLHSQNFGVSASRATSVAGQGGEGDVSSSAYQVGILMKRRRKRGQGYARRYFSLDFASCTLSYYYNRNSSALRGAIPLSLAAISADEGRREFSIDSGAEVWHLKALNVKDFKEWTKALESASNTARGGGALDTTTLPLGLDTGPRNGASQVNPDEDREWQQVEALVSRIVGTRDAVRRLAKTTKPPVPNNKSWGNLGLSSKSSPPVPEEKGDYFGSDSTEKRPFWKRKSSVGTPRLFGERTPSSSQLAAATLAVPSPTTVTTISAGNSGSMPPPPMPHRRQSSREEGTSHDHCAALLNDLDSVLSDFSVLIANNKRRRIPIPRSAVSRTSIDSEATGEFYDAEGGDPNDSQLLIINRHSDEDTPDTEGEDEFLTDSASMSSTDDDPVKGPIEGDNSIFPSKPKSFTPLPITVPVKRRVTLPPATVLPPSLISFLRKNVGKDLSTISMPVSANEPISLLQRQAENLEYAQLLDTAASHKSPIYRLLYVTAFAISYFSGSRARERAIRKPFNPMLGETYELVRAEADVPGNFRFLAEKVSHRPVKIACQGDSPNWSFSQTIVPSQKFWGKSAELITEGRARVSLRLPDGTDEYYSWTVATVFLKNVVMGEKYVEPVGNMTILNETSGAKAVAEFKSKGMFGGRAEDVVVEAYGADGAGLGMGLQGTWTQNLRVLEGKSAKEVIWEIGKLVDGAETRYGLPIFAAQLNEITDIEKGKCAITDSRFRGDQRAAEAGNLDLAEILKQELEEGQRARRRQMEDAGEQWIPRFFVNTADGGEGQEEVWKLKGGKDGYWEERAKGNWTGVEDVLRVGHVKDASQAGRIPGLD
jgi:hypothetical protein